MAHPWADGAWQDDASVDTDSDADPADNQTLATIEFENLLFDAYYESAISAQLFCTLMYWANKGGLKGNTATLGKNQTWRLGSTANI